MAVTIDWANALVQLDQLQLEPDAVNDTLGVLLKYQDDIAKIHGSEANRILSEVKAEIARVEEKVKAKQSHASAAASFFKK